MMKTFTSIKFFSPATFIIAFLGFFLTFTDINCNGTKIDSVAGIEFVRGYKSGLGDIGNDTDNVERYSPNLMLSIAFLIALAGITFSFIRKMAKNYRLNSIIAFVAFICMIGFMLDVRQKVNAIDPANNLTVENYVNLDVEMKFGYWLVTACFLLAATWNWMKGNEKPMVTEVEDVDFPAAEIQTE